MLIIGKFPFDLHTVLSLLANSKRGTVHILTIDTLQQQPSVKLPQEFCLRGLLLINVLHMYMHACLHRKWEKQRQIHENNVRIYVYVDILSSTTASMTDAIT